MQSERIAYWDCSSGVSEEALFAACVDVATAGDSDVKDQIMDIEDCLKRGIPQLNGMFEFQLQPVLCNVSGSGLRLNVQVRADTAPVEFSASEVQDLLQSSRTEVITLWVRDTALEVFAEFASVNQRIQHRNQSSESTVTLESVLCILGTLMSLEILDIKTVSCCPLPIGSQANNENHTCLLQSLDLLIGMPTYFDPAKLNSDCMLKPCAVALLRVLTGVANGKTMAPTSQMVLLGRGTGRISEDNGGVVRVFVGNIYTEKNLSLIEPLSHPRATVDSESQNGGLTDSDLWMSDTISMLETNLDDITGESLAYVIDLLLRNGALDAWVTPIVMKKGRPAHTLHCICPYGAVDDDNTTQKVLEVLFRHTTTLGIRIRRNIPRAKLARSSIIIQTPHVETSQSGAVGVKVGRFKNGDIISVKAEFDDCEAIANETGMPLAAIADYAKRKVLDG